MDKISIEDIKNIPVPKLLDLLQELKNNLKQNPIVQRMYKEYGVDIEEIDYVPMMFGDIDVSAKTDHGIIIFNYKLLQDGDFIKDYSYGVHELSHILQQTANSEPTDSSNAGDYLDNEYEQEGFQNQIEYIHDLYGGQEAERYVEHLLNHHNIEDKEKEEKRDILMSKI